MPSPQVAITDSTQPHESPEESKLVSDTSSFSEIQDPRNPASWATFMSNPFYHNPALYPAPAPMLDATEGPSSSSHPGQSSSVGPVPVPPHSQLPPPHAAHPHLRRTYITQQPQEQQHQTYYHPTIWTQGCYDPGSSSKVRPPPNNRMHAPKSFSPNKIFIRTIRPPLIHPAGQSSRGVEAMDLPCTKPPLLPPQSVHPHPGSTAFLASQQQVTLSGNLRTEELSGTTHSHHIPREPIYEKRTCLEQLACTQLQQKRLLDQCRKQAQQLSWYQQQLQLMYQKISLMKSEGISSGATTSIDVEKSTNSNIGVGVVDQRHITIHQYHMKEKEKAAFAPLSKAEGITTVYCYAVHLFKKNVYKRAKEASGEMSLPINLDFPIRTEKIKIVQGGSRSFKNLDEEGHYNRRKDAERIFSNPHESFGPEELFDCALEEAENAARCTTTNEEAYDKFVRLHGNVVAVIGQAGIGKTTLARKVVQLILEGKLLPNTQYIFYIPFREVNFLKESTLFRFMMTGCNWTHSPESDKIWIDKLKDNPNIVFVFDGLDEANTDQLYKTDENFFPDTSAKPDSFVRDIFSGNVFPCSFKFITSRPRQFYELDPDIRPRFCVEIVGLSKESQENLGRQICKEKFEHVKKFLLENPDIASSLYVPAKCIIVYAILSKAVNEDGKISIRSLTDLFVQLLHHFVASLHLRKKGDEVWKLFVLAWNGFLQRKIIFTEEDFVQAEVSKEAFQGFVETIVEGDITYSILDGAKRCSFSHLIFQELFSAIYAVFFLPNENFQSHLCKLSEPLWEVVSKFMFGLCHPAVSSTINTIPLKISRSSHKKKIKLHQLTLDLLRQECSFLIDSYYETTSSFLQVCGWIQEAGDSGLNSAASSCLPDKIRLCERMFPSDVSSLIYLLRNANKTFTLSILCNFVQDGLQRFLIGIASLPITVEKVAVENSFDDNTVDSLTKSLHCVARLSFYQPTLPIYQWRFSIDEHHLNPESIFNIFQKLALLRVPMKEVDLTCYKVDDRLAAPLARAVGNIKELKLSGRNLSKTVMIETFKEVAKLSQPMEKLCLHEMSDDTAPYLADAVRNIEELELYSCTLSSQALSLVFEQISALPIPIEKLHLNHINMPDAILSLPEGVSKIKVLQLQHCAICGSTLAAMFNKISKLPQGMEELDLYQSRISDGAVMSLAEASSKIKVLKMDMSGLSNDGMLLMFKKLLTLAKPMAQLRYLGSQMSDEATALLVEGLSNIKALDVDLGGISDHGKRLIFKKISALANPMETITLFYCERIADDREERDRSLADVVAGALHNIRTLHLEISDNSFIRLLFEKIASQQQSVQRIILSHVDTVESPCEGDDLMGALVDALRNIKVIEFEGCFVSASGVKLLRSKIASLPPPAAFVGVKKSGTQTFKAFLDQHPSLSVIQVAHSCQKGHPQASETERRVKKSWKNSKVPLVFDNRCLFNIEEFDQLLNFDKVVFLLRDPVTRAYSDYKHITRKYKGKTPPFEEVVSNCLDDLKGKQEQSDFRDYIAGFQQENYVQTSVTLGIYYEFVKEFFKRFDAKDILLLSGEEMKINPAGVMQKMESFLGLPHVLTSDKFVRSNNTGLYCIKKKDLPHELKCLDQKAGFGKIYIPPPDTSTLMKLRDFYRPYNEKLFALTKQTFIWT